MLSVEVRELTKILASILDRLRLSSELMLPGFKDVAMMPSSPNFRASSFENNTFPYIGARQQGSGASTFFSKK